MRSDLLSDTRETLTDAGFYLSRDSPVRPVSFDLVARRDAVLLLVKVLKNVDSLAEAVAHEVKVVAEFLGGSPLLVGERSSSRALDPGVVYARHGIPIMTLGTLREHLLEGLPPLVFAAPGGFYVKIDGARMRRIREERGMSLGQVAEAAGVSRRAISMYEEGMSAMVEVAQRLEEFLDEALAEPVDPFRFRAGADAGVLDLDRIQSEVEREVFRTMESLGFTVAPVEKGPFQAIAAASKPSERRAPREDGVILTGVTDSAPAMARSAAAVANLCEVTETFGAFFVWRRSTTRLSIEGLPLLGVDELSRLDAPDDVISILEERRKRKR